MSSLTRTERRRLTGAGAALLFLGLGFLSYLVAADDAAHGERVNATRLFAAGVAAVGLASAVVMRDRLARLVRQFFSGTTHPLNLAVARVAVFGTFLLLVDVGEIRFFSDLPVDLRFAPADYGSFVETIPIDPTLATLGCIVLLTASFLAMIGLFTPFAAWVVVASAVYVLGIPQLYGKVNHYHHVVWFAAILAVSPCASTLSVDSLRARSKRGNRRLAAPVEHSEVSALPLRFIWLLMGVIYLFPGLAKVWNAGIDWITSDNLRNQLYSTWMKGGGWEPFVRIDRYPVLLKIGAAGVILFEVSFLFLIFFRRLRALAAVAGLGFHTFARLFLGIGVFWTLQTAYVTFVDWAQLVARVRRRLSPAGTRSTQQSDSRSPPRARPVRAVVVVGALLLGVNVLFGALREVHAWPFAAYPFFSHIAEPRVRSIQVVALGPEGQANRVETDGLEARFGFERWKGLIGHVLGRRGVERERRLSALAAVVLENDPSLEAATAIRFEAVTLSTFPERRIVLASAPFGTVQTQDVRDGVEGGDARAAGG